MKGREVRSTAIYSWGLNTSGQLGDGTISSKSVPVEVSELEDKLIERLLASKFNSAAVTKDGRVFIWGRSQEVSLKGTHRQRLPNFLKGRDAAEIIGVFGANQKLFPGKQTCRSRDYRRQSVSSSASLGVRTCRENWESATTRAKSTFVGQKSARRRTEES